MQHNQSPPQHRQASPPLQSTDDGLVRAMSTKYAAERASAKNTPATMRSSDPTPRVGAFSPNANTQATPSGRMRQHNPYRSSDALRALPDEPSVAASAMLPSAAAAAPAGLRARRDPPAPAAPTSTGSPFGGKGGYQAPKLGAATGAAAAAAISDSDDDADGPVQGTDSLTVGGARLSPGAVYNPDVANGAVRSNRSPYLGNGHGLQGNLPSTVGHATVRRTPGARAAPDAAAQSHHHAKAGIATPSFSSSGPHATLGAADLPPRYADPQKLQQQAPPAAPQPQASQLGDDQHGALRNTREGAGRSSARPAGSDAPAPFTARDMERVLQSAIAAGNAAETPDAPPCADVGCPAGLSLTVYNGDISQHFSIPSEHVQITRGAIKYVDHHARYGAQTRFRFQLCHNFLLRKCPKLSECSYIHATQLPAPTQVHLNPFAPRRLAADRHGRSNEVALSAQDDPAVTNAYERLAPGTTLQVHPPQGNQVSADVTVVASEDVFLTVGATDALKQLAAADGDASRIEGPPPRHCTKFQYRRACPAGPTCKGIHSAVPFAGTSLAALHQTQPGRPGGNQPPLRGAAQPFRAAPATTRPPPPVPTALPPAFVPMQGGHPVMVPMVFNPSQTQQPQYAPQAFAVYPQPHGAHNGFPMPVSQGAGHWVFQPQQHAPMAQWVSPPTA